MAKKLGLIILIIIISSMFLAIPVAYAVEPEIPSLIIGDMIFTQNKLLGIGEHVAIYVGNGLVVQAVPLLVEVLPLNDLEEDWAFKCFGGIGSIYRVTDATYAERMALAQYALNQVSKLYFVGTRWGQATWYCTKLAWRSWYEATDGRINLDPCGLLVTPWDMMASTHSEKIY